MAISIAAPWPVSVGIVTKHHCLICLWVWQCLEPEHVTLDAPDFLQMGYCILLVKPAWIIQHPTGYMHSVHPIARFLSLHDTLCRKTVLEYGFHALREEKKNRYVSFRDSLLQVEKQQEQSAAEKQQQQQAAEQARLAEEQLYYAQQQAELASANKGGSSRSTTGSRSFNASAGGGTPDYNSGITPATPGRKPYDESKTKTNFFGMKKKNSHDLGGY